MQNKSIDGLRRRSDQGQRRIIGEPMAKKPTSAPVRRRVAAKQDEEKLEQHDAAIRDFLSSVKDDNPTDLVSEMPEKTTGKKRRKDKPQKPKKKHRVRRIVLWSLGGLFVVAAGLVAWLYIQGNDLVSRVTGGSLSEALFADPDIPLETDPKTGRTNILIFGTEGYSMDDPKHAGGHLTDTMMVASLDQDSGDIRTVSIPRDLKPRTRTCTATGKLNEVYYCTYYKNKGTAESRTEYERLAARALAEQMEEILGIGIQYFVHVNWQALVQIVDALGGIDVAFVYKGTSWSGEEVAIETLDKRGLADYCRLKTLVCGIKFDNGKAYHLDGETALAVARARNAPHEIGGYYYANGYGSNDNFGREQFQQKMIQAIIAKAKKTNFVTDFMATMNIKDAVGDNLRMDFKAKELKSLFKLVGRIDMGGMKSISIQENDEGTLLLTSGLLPVPGVNSMECGGSEPGCLSYVFPKAGVGNYTAIHTYIARKLSSDPVMSENARIIAMNATSVSGVAASEGNRLKAKGFNVTQNINAPSALGEVEGVKIYQKNKSMAGTAQALKQFYNVKISTAVPESLTNLSADFIVVFGNGYATTADN